MLHDALGSHTTRGGGTRPGGGGQSLWRKMGAGRLARDLDRHGDGNQRADGRHLRLDLAPAELSPRSCAVMTDLRPIFGAHPQSYPTNLGA